MAFSGERFLLCFPAFRILRRRCGVTLPLLAHEREQCLDERRRVVVTNLVLHTGHVLTISFTRLRELFDSAEQLREQ